MAPKNFQKPEIWRKQLPHSPCPLPSEKTLPICSQKPTPLKTKFSLFQTHYAKIPAKALKEKALILLSVGFELCDGSQPIRGGREPAINIDRILSTKLFLKVGTIHRAHEKAIPSYLITFSFETRDYYLDTMLNHLSARAFQRFAPPGPWTIVRVVSI
ncbi:hypothetical protein CDAR_566901 [Caerostris darwini]|uniref:Ribosomal protein S10 n=1 Tax=Caerostris darwini TaxID=1538125 RepID=A0AAV4PJA3_9ARAC|nr:hypothetical protein CDAR_566901 [Caerostris darwini]